MKVPFNTLQPGYRKFRTEYLDAVTRVMDSGWYILGEELKSFESEFSRWLGVSHTVGVNSGLDALILGIRALGIGSGDEVVVPANTFIASVLGVTENGAEPVFVEPDEYYNINADKIEEAITSRTKAILVVHLYGQPCRMDKIARIAKEHGLAIVEDCAQSHQASIDGRKVGTFGDIACFSFFPTKNLGAFGDAGAIATNNKQLADLLKIYRNYGSEKKYHNMVQGVNSRLDELQAALLKIKLGHIEKITQEREAIAKIYLQNITNPQISLPVVRTGYRHVWHLFVIRLDKRSELQEYLAENGVNTQIHYPVPPHLAAAYSELGYKQGSFPITERYSNTILSLPLYNGMSLDEARYVVDLINKFK